jgi:hypothetical protein
MVPSSTPYANEHLYARLSLELTLVPAAESGDWVVGRAENSEATKVGEG